MDHNPLLRWPRRALETPEEAHAEGLDFGFAGLALSRDDFEKGISFYLGRLSEILAGHDEKYSIIAAFDGAAWDAWEVGKG